MLDKKYSIQKRIKLKLLSIIMSAYNSLIDKKIKLETTYLKCLIYYCKK